MGRGEVIFVIKMYCIVYAYSSRLKRKLWASRTFFLLCGVRSGLIERDLSQGSPAIVGVPLMKVRGLNVNECVTGYQHGTRFRY